MYAWLLARSDRIATKAFVPDCMVCLQISITLPTCSFTLVSIVRL